MAIVVEFLFYLIMEIIMYTIGRIAIYVFSFGHVRSESLGEMIGSKSMTDGKPNTDFVIPAPACQIIGLIVFTASLMLLLRFRS